MLVISRKNEESICFPGTGIEVRILRPGPSKVRVGIKAPPEIPVLRGELELNGGVGDAEVAGIKSVMIVDDNWNEMKLLAGYLRLKKLEVQTAESGAVAMEQLLSGATPDVVLLDMMMPEYDGAWTINQLRSSPVTEKLKVFAVSGCDPDELNVPIGPSGVDGWYPKPLNPEKLANDLQRQAFLVTT
ncbi:response regulator [Roseiconus lacunae]|uniref:Translational regulator CsrA n=1 Tax=Roseiconus lacunae TaxID=2605694 RepID=A0ABT7PLD1_9BACT|nr:response regulator [Roseiconus lacunae]MCD0460936.1 response regulator [Roseiconus lacunae]MDM4017308.1 response regulator [Roseiconus lacunae]